MITARAKEHFITPRNIGEVCEPDGAGMTGSLTCGAVLRITLRVDGAKRIIEARFKAAGCSTLVASCSMLTENIKGKTTGIAAASGAELLAEIEKMTGRVVGKEHCSALAIDALRAAISNYSDIVRAEWSEEDALICTCFGVAESTIANEIRCSKLSTVNEVTAACRAGAGCGSCYSLIQDMLDDYSHNSFSESEFS